MAPSKEVMLLPKKVRSKEIRNRKSPDQKISARETRGKKIRRQSPPPTSTPTQPCASTSSRRARRRQRRPPRPVERPQGPTRRPRVRSRRRLGYKGPRDETQQSLTHWGEEHWTTADGKPAGREDGMHRYLPEEAWKDLSPAQKKATEKKKLAADHQGKQYVPNTKTAVKARKAAEK